MITASKVSLIIPSYNRQLIVLQTLDYFNSQIAKNFELLVVDQTPSSNKVLQNYSSANFSFNYIKISEIGLPNARNIGAENAKGDILIYVDDDCIPDNNLIQSYIDIINREKNEIECFGGRVIEKGTNIFRQDSSVSGGWITWYGKTLKNFDTDKNGKCEWVPGGNFAVRKNNFFKAGGFDKNFIGNAILEDGDFGFNVRKNGGFIKYYSQPTIEHLRAPTGGTRAESASKGMYYRSHNTVYFLRKHNFYARIIPAFFYLMGVCVKDFFNRKHGLFSIFWTKAGFIAGFFKKVK